MDTPKHIYRRRSHILVYAPTESVTPSGFTALEKLITLREKDPWGASWVTYQGYLYDADPLGRVCLRLPAELPDAVLQAAWPLHTIHGAGPAWERRRITVQFRTDEYPYKNSLQSEIHDYLSNRGKWLQATTGSSKLVVAGTAAGKSYCSIRAWTERGDVLLGTFAQMAHLENFKSELLKFTTLSAADILVVNDGQQSLRSALDHPERAYKVILVLHRTIWFAMQDEIEGQRVRGTNLFVKYIQQLGVGTHISDEAHLEVQSLIYLGLLLNVDQTYYLTATPQRTDWMEDRLLAAQLPKTTALYLRSPPRLETYQISYNTHPNEQEIAKSRNRRDYFDIPGFFSYLMQPSKWPQIEELLTHYVGLAFEAQAPSVGIIVAGKLEFLDMTVQSMQAAFPDRTVGNFSSRIKTGPTRMAELERDIVVTTEKSFGGSINPERMTHLIFLAPVTSAVYLEQISGRLRGLNGRPCIFYDLWDAGFPALRHQAKHRRTILRKLSTTLIEKEHRL